MFNDPNDLLFWLLVLDVYQINWWIDRFLSVEPFVCFSRLLHMRSRVGRGDWLTDWGLVCNGGFALVFRSEEDVFACGCSNPYLWWWREDSGQESLGKSDWNELPLAICEGSVEAVWASDSDASPMIPFGCFPVIPHQMNTQGRPRIHLRNSSLTWECVEISLLRTMSGS